MKIFSVIVHYNSPAEVCTLVRQLLLCEITDHQIIVVDNASSPHNLNALKSGIAQYKTITIIESALNGGFGSGVNRAVEFISKLATDAYVFVVNSDVELISTTFISELSGYLDAYPDVAIVGPKVVEKESGKTQNTILPITTVSTVFSFRKKHSKFNQSELTSTPRQVDCLNGVCFLIRLQVLQNIGGFDEEYFMYNEEQDLCLKITNAGYKIFYLPITSIAHAGAYGNEREKTDWRFMYKRRNIVLFLKKHKGIHQALPVAILFSISSIPKFFRQRDGISWPKFVTELFRVMI